VNKRVDQEVYHEVYQIYHISLGTEQSEHPYFHDQRVRQYDRQVAFDKHYMTRFGW